jgi:hypothetical protein
VKLSAVFVLASSGHRGSSLSLITAAGEQLIAPRSSVGREPIRSEP